MASLGVGVEVSDDTLPPGVVHLAMSFVPGVVVDSWIYGISDAQHKHVDVKAHRLLSEAFIPTGKSEPPVWLKPIA